MKRVLSSLLSLCLILTACPAVFAADEGVSYRPYQYYFSIGDSIAKGEGLGWDTDLGRVNYNNHHWNNGDNMGKEGGHNMPEGFPAQVAHAINPSKTEADGNLQYEGSRSIELYYALGGDVDLHEVDDYYVTYEGPYTKADGGIETYRAEFQKRAAKADLITLSAGCNDVFIAPLALAAAAAGVAEFTDGSLPDPTGVARMALYLKEYADDAFEKYKLYYTGILERISALQTAAGNDPDECDIVLVGIYNPLANAPLADEFAVPVGEILEHSTKRVNEFLQDLARQHDNMYYADISAVETPITTGTMSIVTALQQDMLRNTHPTVEGYKYIARQVLNALPREKIGSSTDILLNLPTDFQVTKVLLDSRQAKFQQTGYELLIPNDLSACCSMTVYGKNAAGDNPLFFYRLQYTEDTGYTTKRIIGTNSIGKSAQLVLNGVLKIFRSAFSLVGKLLR